MARHSSFYSCTQDSCSCTMQYTFVSQGALARDFRSCLIVHPYLYVVPIHAMFRGCHGIASGYSEVIYTFILWYVYIILNVYALHVFNWSWILQWVECVIKNAWREVCYSTIDKLTVFMPVVDTLCGLVGTCIHFLLVFRTQLKFIRRVRWGYYPLETIWNCLFIPKMQGVLVEIYV